LRQTAGSAIGIDLDLLNNEERKSQWTERKNWDTEVAKNRDFENVFRNRKLLEIGQELAHVLQKNANK